MGTHLIQTQIIEAEFRDKYSALEGQKVLQNRCKTTLLPLMEQILDEYDPLSRSLRIEKLEIDLGRIPADLPKDLMRNRLRGALEDQLRKFYLEQGILTHSAHNPLLGKDNSASPDNHSDWEKLTYFLSHGRMPWWALTKEKGQLQSLFNRVTASSDSSLKTWLKENPISLATSIRLTELISQKQLEGFLKSSFHLSIKDIQIINSLLKQLLSNARLKMPESEVRFWLKTVLLLCIFGNRNGFTSYLESGLKSIKKADKNEAFRTSEFLCFLSFCILKISGGNAISGVKKPDSEFIKLIRENAILISDKQNPIASTNQFWRKVVENLQTKLPREEELSTFSKELINQLWQEKKLVEARSPEVDELIVINNAGLVLVTPFLPRFFENIGLVKAREFISSEAQSKAVFLLQEMLGIEGAFDESDLILNKLLCGIDPAAALVSIQEISNFEKLEIDSLLESMATQWTALKSNSGKMIAEGFFRREGSLRRVQRGYQLQIERLSFDLLLDRLPWTIGMIKLPWMEEIITVEW